MPLPACSVIKSERGPSTEDLRMASKYAKLCTSTVRLEAIWHYVLLLLCLLGSEGCRIGDKPSPPHRHATSEHELGPVVKPRHSLAKAYASVVKAMGEDDVHHNTCLGMDRCSIELALSVKQLEDLMRKVEQIGKGKAPSSAIAPSGDKNWSAAQTISQGSALRHRMPP